MATEIGIGTVRLSWMGQLHTRSYQRPLDHYPECELKPRRYDDVQVTEAYGFLRPVGVQEIVFPMRVIDAMDRSCASGRWEKVGGAAPPPDPRVTTG